MNFYVLPSLNPRQPADYLEDGLHPGVRNLAGL